MAKATAEKVSIGVGSVVQLKSDAGKKDRKLTVVGFSSLTGQLTVIWSSDNGNIGKAEIPALAVNVLKS